jgi:Protein of unknown function (DUF1499)
MALYLLLTAVVTFGLYVRLAPSDVGRWHVSPQAEGPWGEVVADERSATLRLGPDRGTPSDLLARLDAVALATARTVRLAGSVGEGRITWVTRSLLWGFPDYTTAEARADGLHVYARNRFGHGDLGVNASRLRDWLGRL